jgi:cytochrome c-type biogenesis protein CcmE
MKKTHIAALVFIAVLIVWLVIFGTKKTDFSTYDSIKSAQAKKGTFVHIIAQLDTSKGIEYDAIKNPNYLAFYAKDTVDGNSITKVVFHNSKPADLEKSQRLVMKGKMLEDHFECTDILLKCPSKYKDDEKQLQKNMQEQTTVSIK